MRTVRTRTIYQQLNPEWNEEFAVDYDWSRAEPVLEGFFWLLKKRTDF